uniref:Rap guanine nucleotide exchange factor 2 n=1 Tax=Myotis myotis TaxID=51298 RepID=A0A7J7XKT9_MYOMY|nr:Rap guanine nucleotide exchange factor 2 [Myotis myotis]
MRRVFRRYPCSVSQQPTHCLRILVTRSLSKLRPPQWLRGQGHSRKHSPSRSPSSHSHHIKSTKDCRSPLCPFILPGRKCPSRISHPSA